MRSFDYLQPSTLGEATAHLRSGTEIRLLAGGMTLLPTIKQRLAAPDALVDLAGVPALTGIEDEGCSLLVGAMARHAAVAASPLVRSRIPALADLAAGIGDPAVRNRGTIGGSLANNDPAADYPAAVLGLGATIVTSEREIAADDFFLGLFETALGAEEIITAIRFPVPRAAAYVKFKAPASRYALVGVFVAQTAEGVRVAVTGAGPAVFRVPAMEEALAADFTPSAVAAIGIDADDLNSDIHAEAGYRAHLVTVMAKRAVAAAAKGF
ncbi:FAD binding domain-containing protein [Labrys monachus]|uniref:Carbon-monoxide dehydrogenase medium subunit n=1 Tax=Labrys monachus TaxID=217067 RepID=A0ABU0F922_9HYPH|nr:xanthine dehydrogenase family protein subunit M [Labrys monachus]MDQ0391105.1 carbon-monoxide dehydrogenase medium subunit [Labrys monachus]